jgi:adenylate kinase family enzyme
VVRRVLVIGCGGSGKSTVARALSRKLGLPLVGVDLEYWRPGWVEPSPEEWEARVRELCAADEWVIDGNYGGTMELRLAHADAAIFLDLRTVSCVAGVLRRYFRWRGRTRPDLPEGCPESIDAKFLRYVLGYRRTRRAGVLERLARFDGDVVVLTSRRAARRYIETAPLA